MKRITAVMACVVLAVSVVMLASTCAFADASRARLGSSTMPEIIQQVGSKEDIVLGPVKYPLFKEAKGDNAACAQSLLDVYDPKTGKGLSLAPVPGSQTEYVLIPDLTLDVAIPKQNRKTTKVLVNWTLRVEGVMPIDFDCKCSYNASTVNKKIPKGGQKGQDGPEGSYIPFPCLCPSGWHGSTVQVFKGGMVNSRLKVNGQEVGNLASLTMPDGGAITATQVYDPTITGNFLVTKDLFGGEFPEKLKIEIYWQNQTTLKLVSPKNTHMVVVSVMPITASD